MKLVRIAVAARDVLGTGGGTVAIETARYFAQIGHEVHFVVDTDIPLDMNGAHVHVTPFGNALKRWQPRGRITFRLRHLLQLLAFSLFGSRVLRRLSLQGCVSLDHNIEAFGADVLVLHNVFIAQFRADRRRWFRKIPQFFNPIFGFRLWRERIALRSPRTRAVIAVSEQTLEEARPFLRPGVKTAVIYNGINLERFSPCGAAQRAAQKVAADAGGRFMLLFVGHEFERKRLDLVIGALALLPPEVGLWVIGGRSSSHAAYQKQAKALNVAERVDFLGTMTDPVHYFQAADAFVLPSDYETWGLVVLEAMACGTPVLMTPVGCAPHVVHEGQTGYVLEWSAQSIADKTRLLVQDPALHARMRHAARHQAAGYAWDKVARNYLDAIKALEERQHGT